MKYCIMMQDVYTLGGIQKVIESYSNELIKNNDVTIIMPFTVKNKEKQLIKLDEKIKIIDFNNLNKTGLIRKSKNFLVKLNKKYNFFNKLFNDKQITRIIYSKKMRQSLIDIINKEKYDFVIAAGGDYWTNLLGSIAPFISAVTIGWQHTIFDSYFLKKGKCNFGLKLYSKKMYNQLDQIWVLTNKDKEKFDKFLNMNTFVCYNPIISQENRANLLGKNVLFLGRMNKENKGLNYLVDIIYKTVEKDNTINFQIVGDGPDKKWLKNELEKNNLNNNVKMYKSTNDVYKYYNNSDLLIQTSTYEGFGMTIVEAMSCGLPVISFHNDGPDEIITNNIDGILIDKYNTEYFAEKIVDVINNKEKSKKLAINALNMIEKYYVYNFIEKTNKELKRIKGEKDE